MEKRLMMFLAGLFLSIGMAVAQTQVSGTVVSGDDGEPVIGASIKVVGTNTVQYPMQTGSSRFQHPLVRA